MAHLRRSLPLIAFAIVVGTAIAAAPQDKPAATAPSRPAQEAPESKVLLERLSTAAEEAMFLNGLAGTVDVMGNVLTVTYDLREYMVYEKDENGRFGEELVKVVGPDYAGFMFSVTLHEGAWDQPVNMKRDKRRPEARPDQYLLGSRRTKPYFTVYPSVTTLDRINRHLVVDITVGPGFIATIDQVQAVHKAMLNVCADQKWCSPTTRRR